MAVVLALLLALSTPGAPALPGIPPPPDAVFEAELTKAANDRATVEMRNAVAALDKDVSVPEAQKRELKAKIARVKVALYTTPKTLDETVAFYEKKVPNATFLFAERDALSDLQEVAAAGNLQVSPEVARAWLGKRVRSARWNRPDRTLEIDVEDTLIDPRDAKVSRKTVVLITFLAD